MEKFTLDADDSRFDDILQQCSIVGKKIEPDFKIFT
jgi:hypothetical protein